MLSIVEIRGRQKALVSKPCLNSVQAGLYRSVERHGVERNMLAASVAEPHVGRADEIVVAGFTVTKPEKMLVVAHLPGG